MALITVPPHSTVHIYMDSKALIDKYRLINADCTYFKFACITLADSYLSLWFILFDTIQHHDLCLHLYYLLFAFKSFQNYY